MTLEILYIFGLLIGKKKHWIGKKMNNYKASVHYKEGMQGFCLFPYFIFALVIVHTFLKIATRGQEWASVSYGKPGLDVLFRQCPHRAITGPIAEIKKLRPKVK